MRLVGVGFGLTGANITLVEIYSEQQSRKLNSNIEHNCEVITQVDSLITLIAPKVAVGITTIILSANGQICQKNFNYSAPSITYVSFERGGDAAGGEQLRVYGNNFGYRLTFATLRFSDGTPVCQSKIELILGDTDAHVQCLTASTNAGWKNITIHIAGQDSLNAQYFVECKSGSYGEVGGRCHYCGNAEETGQYCPYNAMSLPISAPGWYMINSTYDDHRCLSNFTSSHICNSLWPCYPSFSCIGNNDCASNYDGMRCSLCDSGSYKINGICDTCPNEIWPLVLTLLAFLLVVSYVIYRVTNRSIYFGNSTIGIDYLQSLGLLSNCKHLWKKPLLEILNAFSILNLNFDILALKCWGINPTFEYTWIIKQILPISLFIILIVTWNVCNRFNSNQGEIRSSHNSFWILYVMVTYLIYVAVTHNSLSIFDCLETDPPDGFSYLSAVGVIRSAICYAPDSLQRKLQPWAIVSFIVYSVGLIIALGLMLYSRHILNFVSILLKHLSRRSPAISYGKLEDISEITSSLKSCFGSLNENWILVLMLRKLALCCSLVVSKNPIVILTVFWCVHLIATLFQLNYSPYKRVNVLYSPLPSPAPTSPTSSISTVPQSLEDLFLCEEGFDNIFSPTQTYMDRSGRSRTRVFLHFLMKITDPNKAEVICIVSILIITAAGIIQELNSKYTLLQTILTNACTTSIIVTLIYLLISVILEHYVDTNFNSLHANKCREDLDSIDYDFEAGMGEEMKTEDNIADSFPSSDNFCHINPMKIDLSSSDNLNHINPMKIDLKKMDNDSIFNSTELKMKEKLGVVSSNKRQLMNSLQTSLLNKHNRQKPSLVLRKPSNEMSLTSPHAVNPVSERILFKQDMPHKKVVSLSSPLNLKALNYPIEGKSETIQDRKSMIDKKSNSVSFYSISFDETNDYSIPNEPISEESQCNDELTLQPKVSCRENRSIHELSAIHRKKLENLKTLRKTNHRPTLTNRQTITYDSNQEPIIMMGPSYGSIIQKNNE